MTKRFLAASLLAGSLACPLPANALQLAVTQIDKNGDSTLTYHFAITIDPGETLAAGTAADFVTVYNFYGLVDGSVKTPPGWTFTSEDFGRTPSANGYPAVAPLDIPGTPNLTWTTAKDVAAGTVEGFSATTRMGGVVEGSYAAQVSRQAPAVRGAPPGTPVAAPVPVKVALISTLPTPSFLAEVK